MTIGDQEEQRSKQNLTQENQFLCRIRNLLGASERQWEYLISASLIAPYILAIFVYLYWDINEMTFLIGTLVYSILAAVISLHL
jgi:hypothetical protein